jgi:O-antigen ligase
LASLSAAAFSGLLALGSLALALGGFFALRQLGEKSRKLLLSALVASGLVQALLALAFYDPSARPKAYALLEKGEGRYQLLGTLGNPGDVAVFLVVPTLLSLQLALGKKKRLGWLIAALLQGATILASQTLSALGALVLGLAVFLALSLPRPKRLWAAATLGITLGLMVVGFSPLRQRLGQAFAEVRQNGFLWVASGRGAGWTAAWNMFAAHPLLGVGWNQFEAHFFRFLPPQALAERARVLRLETGFGEAHNEFLQYLAETGLAGAGLLLAGLWLALRRRRASSPGKLLQASPLLAAMGLLACFQFPLHLAATAAQWLVVGVLLLPPLPVPERRKPVGVLLGLCLGAGVAAFTWEQWRTARAMQAAEVLVENLRAQGSSAASKALAAQAYQGFTSRLRYWPWSYRGENMAGNLAMVAGLWPEAEAHFRRAVALAERPELRFNWGLSLLALGQEGEGLEQLARAVELNPAVLQVVEDPLLAKKLALKLQHRGYFRQFPWALSWLPKTSLEGTQQ